MNMTVLDVYSVLMDAGFTPADTFDSLDGKLETFYGGAGESLRVSLYPDDGRLEITGLDAHGHGGYWDLRVPLSTPVLIFAATLSGAVAHWPAARS